MRQGKARKLRTALLRQIKRRFNWMLRPQTALLVYMAFDLLDDGVLNMSMLESLW